MQKSAKDKQFNAFQKVYQAYSLAHGLLKCFQEKYNVSKTKGVWDLRIPGPKVKEYVNHLELVVQMNRKMVKYVTPEALPTFLRDKLTLETELNKVCNEILISTIEAERLAA